MMIAMWLCWGSLFLVVNNFNDNRCYEKKVFPINQRRLAGGSSFMNDAKPTRASGGEMKACHARDYTIPSLCFSSFFRLQNGR